MKLRKSIALLVIFLFLLAGCAPAVPGTTADTPPPATETPAPPAPVENEVPVPIAVLEAQRLLAERLGIELDQVVIREIEQAQWPDGCLGLPQPDEMCTEALVDGFRAVFSVDGQEYEYRTDMEGKQIRSVEGGEQAGSGPIPEDSQLPGSVLSARQVLSQRIGVDLDQIEIVSVEQVEWPDSCLGVKQAGQMCAMVITPGYRVVFRVDGKQYEFHTDQEGGSVIAAQGPLPKLVEKVLVWEQTENGVCSRVEVSQAAAAFGPCGGSMNQGRITPERLEELQTLISMYAPFVAGTPAGTIDFKGHGEQVATEAEQRSIAEWAKLVYQEAQAGRSGASWGMIFAWHQEGGIAGLCSDVTLYTTGWYYVTNCQGGQPEDLGHFRLNAQQLAAVYDWVDRYQGFEYEHTDPAVADAMSTRMVFSGNGQETITAEQQQVILALAAQLFGEAAW